MFDSVQVLLGEVLACGAPTPAEDCREQAAGELSEHDLDADVLVERIAAAERLSHAVAAAQTRDIHALATARLAADRDRAGVGTRLEGRTTAFEVGLACRVSAQSATSRCWHGVCGWCCARPTCWTPISASGSTPSWALTSPARTG